MIDVFLIMGSIHLDSHHEYNQINPGIAIRHEHVVAGIYENSFNDTSIFVGGDKHWSHGNFEYGAMAGLVSGYEESWTVGDMTAFVAPYVTYRTETISPTVLLFGNAITLSFKVEL
ncbi:hypothetical protein [Vibrio phage vB_VaS_L1]|nr:hypothetical protein [Vibrio phage vB_VaS_L1]